MRTYKLLILILMGMFICVSMQAQERQLQHPWKGKRVALLGDSISDPNGPKYWGHPLYFSYLEAWLGMEVYDYAVSGREWNDIPRQVSQLEKEHGADVDAFLILMGTNDYNMGVPTGEWYTETIESVLAGSDMREPATMQFRKRRTLVMDNATVKGRINIALKFIKEKYPRCPIVLLTPLKRGWFQIDEGNVQPEETYQNRAGEYLDAYVDAVKEAADVWSVNVIDLHAVSNMDPLHGQDFYFQGGNDLLHPGSEGSRHLASVLYYQLLPIVVKDL